MPAAQAPPLATVSLATVSLTTVSLTTVAILLTMEEVTDHHD